jgi:hypothetical protein
VVLGLLLVACIGSLVVAALGRQYRVAVSSARIALCARAAVASQQNT